MIVNNGIKKFYILPELKNESFLFSRRLQFFNEIQNTERKNKNKRVRRIFAVDTKTYKRIVKISECRKIFRGENRLLQTAHCIPTAA